MIGRLRGLLDSIATDHVIVDVHGVGYVVVCGARTVASLPRQGEAVDLLIETQVREDSLTLFGFVTQAERQWFRLLQNIQGVGSRLALALLGVCAPDDLARAVAAQDRAVLTRAPGVGPKLAERIVRELKDKIGQIGAAPGTPAPGAAGAVAGRSDFEDALSALVNLGYGRSEAHRALEQAVAELGSDTSLDRLIRAGLKALTPA
ncbi:Holliday junction branch migration protein RuvA [Marinivivus vitaminiproducens]|uniref:Holliday junction branch migration protein RuvA n=1 Tax=Marinivivus vitaminiproducens TaxID=3035935 RepID=UPI00279CA889|nr:Holliday junction branch migration protein RuvA [Geminicoccaceae bacterium SCSIO 64248]